MVTTCQCGKRSTETSPETRRDANKLDRVMKRKLCSDTFWESCFCVELTEQVAMDIFVTCSFFSTEMKSPQLLCSVKEETTNFILLTQKIYFGWSIKSIATLLFQRC